MPHSRHQQNDPKDPCKGRKKKWRHKHDPCKDHKKKSHHGHHGPHGHHGHSC